jgi:hypothetical protein
MRVQHAIVIHAVAHELHLRQSRKDAAAKQQTREARLQLYRVLLAELPCESERKIVEE